MNKIELYERLQLLEHRFNQLEESLDAMDKYRFSKTGNDVLKYEDNYCTARFKRKVIHSILDDFFEELKNEDEK